MSDSTPTIAAQIEALAAKATARPWNHLGYCGQDAVIQGPRQMPIGTMISGKSSGETGHQCYDNAALAVLLVNNLPAIVTALRQAEAAPGVGWLPIATLPEDAPKFDLWVCRSGHVEHGARRVDCFWHNGLLTEHVEYDEDAGFEYVSQCGYVSPVETVVVKATHWMPLPAAPATDEGESHAQ
jgi:hypothetical protein